MDNGDQGVWKVATFTAKGTSLHEKNVVWAILREGPLRGLTPRAEIEKSQKVSDSHRNVSPLTQGLRYRAACNHQVVQILSGPLGDYRLRGIWQILFTLWKKPHTGLPVDSS